ncbi:InsB [Shigella sonnei]|nr:InsB [Shigella sonnei]
MLGGADNPNGELPSYITGADNTNDVLVLMSGRVVTKANLSHVDGGVRCSLVNCSTVATTELFNRHFRIFAVPLIKSSAVTEATLGQID